MRNPPFALRYLGCSATLAGAAALDREYGEVLIGVRAEWTEDSFEPPKYRTLR